MDVLAVYINNEIVFEFDKEHSINDEQLAFFDRMDADMDKGIKINGKLIETPDSRQRATFVSMNILKAIQQDNQAILTALCAYLNNRIPMLIKVHAKDSGNKINIEFIDNKSKLLLM